MDAFAWHWRLRNASVYSTKDPLKPRQSTDPLCSQIQMSQISISKYETLKDIIDSSEYLKEHSPNSTAAYIRKQYAINCNTMISYGIDENKTYTTAVKIFQETHPEIPLIDI